jgi:magnesium-transporting ATPase (P-type)
LSFSGGFVLAGTMKGIVVKTGLKTKSGKMAKRTQMPLSKNLLDLRISLYKNNILSLDPSRVGYMKKKFDKQKIEHKAAPVRL